MALKVVDRNNPCPICARTNGCKKSDKGVLCLSYCSCELGEVIPGADGLQWRCNQEERGPTAAFALYTGRERLVSPERQAEWDRKKREAKAREIEAEVKADDRNGYLMEAFGQLPLVDMDRQSLLDRKFTKLEIEIAGFKSIEKPYPKVKGEFPKNLPGYNPKFGSLQVCDRGILCPIPDFKDRWVSAQVRLAEVREDEGRYRWLINSKLNGEMPIACWDKLKGTEPDAIWVTEGTSIKSALAHFRLRAPVIGSSGGLFASSPKNFADTWRHLSAKYRTNKLVVAVDAGDVVNPHVAHRLEAQFRFFGQLGCDVRVAWWGQVEKELSCDIDELQDLGAIELLSLDEFRDILTEYKPERDRKLKEIKARSQQLREAKVCAIAPKEKECDREEDPQWQSWKAARRLSADDKIHLQYFNYRVPEKGEILLGLSPTGTGKTEYVARLFRKGGAFYGKKLISFFSRNSLIVNTCKRIDEMFQLSDELTMMLADPSAKVGLCTNSIKKFSNPEWFDDAVIFVDELESVMSHVLISSTHNRDRVLVLDLLREAFKRAYCVIGMDANLTDRAAGWVQTLAPFKRITKVVNNYKQPRSLAEIFRGCPRKSGKLNSKALSPLIAAMLATNLPFLVLSDSQIKLEQIEKLLKKAGKRGIRIDSKTTEKGSEEKRCLEDVNAYIREQIDKGKPLDYFMGSPTLGVGVDINVPGYFKDSYVLLNGVIATDDAMQLAGRCRDTGTVWHIAVPEKSFIKASNFIGFDYFNIGKISQRLMDFAKMDLSYLKENIGKLSKDFLGWIAEAKENPDCHYALMLHAKEAYEKQNLRRCLKQALLDAGHEVKEVWDVEVAKIEAMLKTSKDEIKIQTATEIFESADITEEEAERLSRSYSSTWEERKQIKKASIRKMLPGLDETEFWNKELFYYLEWENPRAISQANLLHLFHNPHLANKKQTDVWARIASDRKIILSDLYSQNLKVEALKFINFEQFLETEKQWTKDSPEIIELVKKGQREAVQLQLGNVPKNRKGEADGIKYLQKLLDLVGLKLGKGVLLPREADKPRARAYSLDMDAIESQLRLAMAEAVARRYEEYDREWVLPEVLQVPAQQVAVEEIEPEPETDSDGIDWRGVQLELKEAFGGLGAGTVVEAVGQAREVGEKVLIWVQSAIGRVRLELGMLNLYFE